MTINSERILTQSNKKRPGCTKIKSNFLQQLAQFEDKMCDVTLCAKMDGTKIPTHRLVLSVSSKFFESLFTSGMKAAGDETIDIDGIPGNVLKSLVHFLYTEEIDLDEQNVQRIQQIAKASVLLQLDILAEYCGELLTRKISLSNCFGLAVFAETFGLKKLRQIAHGFVLANFEMVYHQPEFNEIPLTFLTNILRNSELTVSSEGSRFYAIRKWFSHDPERRKSSLIELLPLIRICKLDVQITGTALFDFCKKFECSLTLVSVMMLQLKEQESEQSQSQSGSGQPKSQERSEHPKSQDECEQQKSQDGSVQSRNQGESEQPKSQGESEQQKNQDKSEQPKSQDGSEQPKSRDGNEKPKSQEEDEQQKIQNGSEQQQDHGASNTISKRNESQSEGLIAFAQPNMLLFYPSSEQDRWKALSHSLDFLHPKDSIIGMGLNNTELVFVCSTSKKTLVKTIDLISGEKRSHVLLLESNLEAKAVIHNKNVYILGHSFRKYDLRSQIWRELPSANTSRSLHCVVIFGNHLYAIGGRHTSVVERFDLTANQWEPVSILTNKDIVATVFAGCIYVIGPGCVQRSNPNNQWTKVSHSTPFHHVHSAVAFENHIYIAGADERNQKFAVCYNPLVGYWCDVPRFKGDNIGDVHLITCNLPLKTLD